MTRLWFDICRACRTWQVARRRRRGGQLARCDACGGTMARVTDEQWMEALVAATEPEA